VQILDARGEESIPLVMDVARKMAKTNAALDYGEIGPFVRDVLKKSRSWPSWYVSLDALSGHVDEARAWAAETREAPIRLRASSRSSAILSRGTTRSRRSSGKRPRRRYLSKIAACTDELVAAVLAQANDLPGNAEVFQTTVRDLVGANSRRAVNLNPIAERAKSIAALNLAEAN
jgi:hypothetical protein